MAETQEFTHEHMLNLRFNDYTSYNYFHLPAPSIQYCVEVLIFNATCIGEGKWYKAEAAGIPTTFENGCTFRPTHVHRTW